jgi:aspartate-semialdehyde dehydrogenase
VVRVPAFHGSAVALFLPTGKESSEWAARLRSAPGIILVESDEVAGLVDAVSQEAVIVRMTQTAAGAALWCAFDAARLAALTAVWIAEALSEKRVAQE